MSTVAAVDIGASSGRVFLATLDGGIPTMEETHRFRNSPIEDGGRWVWPIDELISQIQVGLKCAHDLGAESCGIDTWAVDYAVIDPDGARVGPVFAYRDPHHAQGIARVRSRVSWDEQYRISGIQDMPINSIYQIAAENPTRVDAAHRLLLVPDYVTYRLTGVIGAEVTNASSTSLVDPRTRTWSDALTSALDLPASFLPEIHEPGRDLGESRGPGALRVISVATHDTASAFAGTPLRDRDEALVVSLGTWALVGYETTDANPNAATEAINLTHELGVDRTVRCLRNVPGMWLFEECRRTWEQQDGAVVDAGKLLAAAAESRPFAAIVDIDQPSLAAPGQSPERVMTYLAGRIPVSRGQVVRALMDSLVARLASHVRLIEQVSGRQRPTIHIVGGASRIDFLMQAVADATDKPVVAGPVEAASLGNAAVQWCAGGVFSGIAEVRGAIARMPEIRRFEPEGDREVWREFAGRLGWEI